MFADGDKHSLDIKYRLLSLIPELKNVPANRRHIYRTEIEALSALMQMEYYEQKLKENEQQLLANPDNPNASRFKQHHSQSLSEYKRLDKERGYSQTVKSLVANIS